MAVMLSIDSLLSIDIDMIISIGRDDGLLIFKTFHLVINMYQKCS